ncbi:MAG: ABC transporter ATP-binding protein/permease [Defluviitaleaceae bacterium]|nr:ABC transporter ATP-binding protein/permease [Defluviitaleaceae bacterium]
MKNKIKILYMILKKSYKLRPSIILLSIIDSILQVLLLLFYVLFPPFLLSRVLEGVRFNLIIWNIIIGMSLLLIIRLISNYLNYKLEIDRAIINELFIKNIYTELMTVSFVNTEDPDFIDLKEKALFPFETQTILTEIFTYIPKIFKYLFLSITIIAIVFSQSLVLLLFMIMIQVVSFIVNNYVTKKENFAKKSMAELNKEYVYYFKLFQDTNIAKDVRVYGIQNYLLNRVSSVFSNFVSIIKKIYQSVEIRGLTIKMSTSLIILIVSIYLAFNISRGLINISQFLIIFSACVSLNDQVMYLINEILLLNSRLLFLNDYMEYEKTVTIYSDKGTISLDTPIKTIEFKNVWFKYPKATDYTLKEINLHIKTPTILAIVGKNGSGKTTMIKLLSKLYEPTQGDILINGINLKDIKTDSYFKALSVIFQDFKLFHFTIKENLYFNKNIEVDLKKILEEVDIKKDIEKLKEGLDTFISKDFDSSGIDLSKGQEQKLAIARSMMQSSSVFVMDEPTAALDPISEAKTFEQMNEICRGKMAIFISHRLSSCKFSNEIIFLSNGSITEKGNHGELIELGKEYKKMYDIQAKKYL